MENRIGDYDYGMYQYWVCSKCSHLNPSHLFICEQCYEARWELYKDNQYDDGKHTWDTTYYYPLGWQCPNCKTIHNPETKMCFCNKKKEAVNEHGEWEEIED